MALFCDRLVAVVTASEDAEGAPGSVKPQRSLSWPTRLPKIQLPSGLLAQRPLRPCVSMLRGAKAQTGILQAMSQSLVHGLVLLHRIRRQTLSEGEV